MNTDGAKLLEISTDEVAGLIELASEDLEIDRAESLKLADESFGGPAKVLELFKAGTFGAHEAMDRLHMLMQMIDDYALEHPTVAMKKSAYWRVRLAGALLQEAYQEIGQDDFG